MQPLPTALAILFQSSNPDHKFGPYQKKTRLEGLHWLHQEWQSLYGLSEYKYRSSAKSWSLELVSWFKFDMHQTSSIYIIYIYRIVVKPILRASGWQIIKTIQEEKDKTTKKTAKQNKPTKHTKQATYPLRKKPKIETTKQTNTHDPKNETKPKKNNKKTKRQNKEMIRQNKKTSKAKQRNQSE